MTTSSSAGRHRGLRSIHAVLVVAIVLIAAGCSAIPAPGVDGTLVVVETRGGLCVNGPCGSRIAIDADGRVHQLAPKPVELGKVPADALGALFAAVRTADFAAIKGRPFRGECPVNFDGQEVIYEFSLASGTETIASCTIEVDPDAPPFVAVWSALALAR